MLWPYPRFSLHLRIVGCNHPCRSGYQQRLHQLGDNQHCCPSFWETRQSHMPISRPMGRWLRLSSPERGRKYGHRQVACRSCLLTEMILKSRRKGSGSWSSLVGRKPPSGGLLRVRCGWSLPITSCSISLRVPRSPLPRPHRSLFPCTHLAQTGRPSHHSSSKLPNSNSRTLEVSGFIRPEAEKSGGNIFRFDGLDECCKLQEGFFTSTAGCFFGLFAGAGSFAERLTRWWWGVGFLHLMMCSSDGLVPFWSSQLLI